MPAYFTSLRVAANSAAAPASRAASVTYDSARGQDTVTSHFIYLLLLLLLKSDTICSLSVLLLFSGSGTL